MLGARAPGDGRRDVGDVDRRFFVEYSVVVAFAAVVREDRRSLPMNIAVD
jgi:hypothetical protein